MPSNAISRTLDRAFGCLLLLATAGHIGGTFVMLPFMSGLFVWSLGSALAAALLGVLNLLRAGRPEDKTLALITAIGTLCWAIIALLFARSIGNMLDPRALCHFLIAGVLVGFSVNTLRSGAHPAVSSPAQAA